MSGNVVASGDWPGDRAGWLMRGAEMRGSGLSGVGDVGSGIRRLGGLGMFASFHPDFSSETVVPETVPPAVIDTLGTVGTAGAG